MHLLYSSAWNYTQHLLQVASRGKTTYSSLSAVLAQVPTAAVKGRASCTVQVYHEMVVMERIHQNQTYSPGVTLESLTRPPLRLH